jgi:hypothetical protein
MLLRALGSPPLKAAEVHRDSPLSLFMASLDLDATHIVLSTRALCQLPQWSEGAPTFMQTHGTVAAVLSFIGFKLSLSHAGVNRAVLADRRARLYAMLQQLMRLLPPEFLLPLHESGVTVSCQRGCLDPSVANAFVRLHNLEQYYNTHTEFPSLDGQAQIPLGIILFVFLTHCRRGDQFASIRTACKLVIPVVARALDANLLTTRRITSQAPTNVLPAECSEAQRACHRRVALSGSSAKLFVAYNGMLGLSLGYGASRDADIRTRHIARHIACIKKSTRLMH